MRNESNARSSGVLRPDPPPANVKMRYKAPYHPSELLCPLRYLWVSFDIAKRLLDRKQYVVLSDYANLENNGDLLDNNVLEDEIKQEEERFGEGSNDVPVDGDEEMSKENHLWGKLGKIGNFRLDYP
ncbi:hypothetical protein L1887_38972 [Cichorium endivia]|nr:hypothetical protein L1887_38972 [Cichorium endivia]